MNQLHIIVKLLNFIIKNSNKHFAMYIINELALFDIIFDKLRSISNINTDTNNANCKTSYKNENIFVIIYNCVSLIQNINNVVFSDVKCNYNLDNEGNFAMDISCDDTVSQMAIFEAPCFALIKSDLLSIMVQKQVKVSFTCIYIFYQVGR